MNDRSESRTSARVGAPGLMLLGPALLVLYALLCEKITSSAAIPGPLRLDMVALAILGAVTLRPSVVTLPGVSTGGGAWARPAVGGGILGAAAVAPWVAVGWLVVPALAFLWGSWNQGRRAGCRTVAVVALLLGAMVNLATVSVATAWGLRVPPDDFAARDFRVNTLLADVPLHDVWVVDLGSRGPATATLDDLAEAFRRFSPFQGTPAVVGLGVLRGLLGWALGWDDPRWDDEEVSYVQRLTEGDGLRSKVEPGTRLGIWRVVYAFPEEGVVEAINGTVHVAVSCSIGEGAEGPSIFLAFRVQDVNWTTPFYMGLIDPFRRYLVYPPLIRQFAHTLRRGG